MATYTTRNRLVKQATNENRNTWGEVLNAGMIEIIDFSIDGIVSKSLSGDISLTTANGAADEARARTILITSTGGSNRIITIPLVEKTYHVINDGANVVTIKGATGTTAIVPAGTTALVFCDGTNCRKLYQPRYGLISTTASGTGNSLTLTLDGFGCNDFVIRFSSIQLNVAAAVRIELSTDNASFSTAVPVWTAASGASVGYGDLELERATDGLGSLGFSIGSLGASPATTNVLDSNVTTTRWPWRVTGGIKYVRLTTSVGNFAAGNFLLYGR